MGRPAHRSPRHDFQLVAAPELLADHVENVYAGYALCELRSGIHRTAARGTPAAIFPFSAPTEESLVHLERAITCCISSEITAEPNTQIRSAPIVTGARFIKRERRPLDHRQENEAVPALRGSLPALIKLYTDLAHKDEWFQLSAGSRGLLVSCWVEYALAGTVLELAQLRRRSGLRVRSEKSQTAYRCGLDSAFC